MQVADQFIRQLLAEEPPRAARTLGVVAAVDLAEREAPGAPEHRAQREIAGEILRRSKRDEARPGERELQLRMLARDPMQQFREFGVAVEAGDRAEPSCDGGAGAADGFEVSSERFDVRASNVEQSHPGGGDPLGVEA